MSRRKLYYYEFNVKVSLYCSFTFSLISDVEVTCEIAEKYFLDFMNNYVHSNVSIEKSWRSTRKSALENSLIINASDGF